MGGMTVISSHSLKCGLLEYWSFEDAAGSGTVVASYSGKNGVVGGAITQHVTSKSGLGYCIHSPGNVGDYIQFTSVGGIYPGYDEGTLSIWFNMDTLPSVKGHTYRLIEFKCPSPKYQTFRIFVSNSDNKLYFYTFSNTSEYTASWSTVLTASTWYHVVGVVNGGSPLVIYVNASSANSVPTGGNFTDFMYQFTSNQYLYMTNSSTGDNYGIDGLIDEVGIWGRALSSIEITDLYRSGSGLIYPFS